MPKFHEKNSKSFRKYYTTNIWNHQHAINTASNEYPNEIFCSGHFFSETLILVDTLFCGWLVVFKINV